MGTFYYFMRNEHTPLMGKNKAPEQASRWTWKLNCFYLPVISCSCGPQFFLKESHLGQNRATCSLQQLSDLNPRVRVSAHTGPLDDDLLLQFQVRQALSVAPNCASGFMLISIKITKLEDYLFVYFCLIISNLSTKILKNYLDSFFLIEGSKIYPNIFQKFNCWTKAVFYFTLKYILNVCVHRSFHVSTSQFCKFVCWTTIGPKVLLKR